MNDILIPVHRNLKWVYTLTELLHNPMESNFFRILSNRFRSLVIILRVLERISHAPWVVAEFDLRFNFDILLVETERQKVTNRKEETNKIENNWIYSYEFRVSSIYV
jgi:hypothetical protein